MSWNIPSNFGYVAAVSVAFWVQQSVLFVIPVVQQRIATGIKAPTLYPTDKEVTLSLPCHESPI